MLSDELENCRARHIIVSVCIFVVYMIKVAVWCIDSLSFVPIPVVLSLRFSSQGASNDGSNRRDRISHIRTVFKVSEKDASDSL